MVTKKHLKKKTVLEDFYWKSANHLVQSTLKDSAHGESMILWALPIRQLERFGPCYVTGESFDTMADAKIRALTNHLSSWQMQRFGHWRIIYPHGRCKDSATDKSSDPMADAKIRPLANHLIPWQMQRFGPWRIIWSHGDAKIRPLVNYLATWQMQRFDHWWIIWLQGRFKDSAPKTGCFVWPLTEPTSPTVHIQHTGKEEWW